MTHKSGQTVVFSSSCAFLNKSKKGPSSQNNMFHICNGDLSTSLSQTNMDLAWSLGVLNCGKPQAASMKSAWLSVRNKKHAGIESGTGNVHEEEQRFVRQPVPLI